MRSRRVFCVFLTLENDFYTGVSSYRNWPYLLKDVNLLKRFLILIIVM